MDPPSIHLYREAGQVIREGIYSSHQAQFVIATSAATKQSQSEMATPFGLAMTTFCSSG